VDDDRPGPGIASRPAPGLLSVEQPFVVFYDSELPKVVRFLMKLGASPTEAAESAQAAMVEAWLNWTTISEPGNAPAAWVRTVAKRAFFRSAARPETPTEKLPELPILAADTVLEISERTRFAHELLAKLPYRQREVMAWTADGFGDDRIAVELGTTRAAIRKSRQRARDTLKMLLREGGPT
jgi:RNA polymerase sigma-70 factor (ECF subfamily)